MVLGDPRQIAVNELISILQKMKPDEKLNVMRIMGERLVIVPSALSTEMERAILKTDILK